MREKPDGIGFFGRLSIRSEATRAHPSKEKARKTDVFRASS
jgi:hypothetical protein